MEQLSASERSTNLTPGLALLRSRLASADQLIDQSMVSLLRCFNQGQSRFYPTILGGRLPPRVEPTWRDSAIVLTAIDKASARINHELPAPAKDDFFKGLKSDRADPRVISYDGYHKHVFASCLHQIAVGGPKSEVNDILGVPGEIPFKHREPFTCARILGLLNIYGSRETHQKVYVHALKCVLDAVFQQNPPHYAFGGASLSGSEPHAFVSYYCLKSLKGIASELHKRHRLHEQLAALLEETEEWLTQKDGRARLVFPEWAQYRAHVETTLESLKDTVGLEDVVMALRMPASGDDPLQRPADVCKAVTQVLRKTIVPWLDGFLGLVTDVLTAAPAAATPAVPGAPVHSAGAPVDPPGAAQIRKARQLTQDVAGLWVLAFFDGMRHVLEQIRQVYASCNADDLPTLATAIRKAGVEWRESADRTSGFVANLSKWATAEMHWQLALYSVSSHLDFDAGQLAFCLRIYHDCEPSRDDRLAAKALDVLLQSQLETGTWPVGAALASDPETGASVYPTNLEMINAVMPLIASQGGIRQHPKILDRIVDWLTTNQRSIQFGDTVVRGWSSDYIWDRGRVDVWDTAIALEFLVSYRDLLIDFMVQDVSQGGCDTQWPDALHVRLNTLVDPQLERPPEARITSQILQGYVLPFQKTGRSGKSSMILYGPPGTAKSTFAEAIAKELGWPLLTITPSDFVKNGIERSEDMARTIFNDLLELRKVVVLFDECDEMFRSRSDPDGQNLGMLRFIVPGMLPKLQRLKKHGEQHGLIVVIATNYYDRLDSAIVRPGRVDERFLVPPYDRKARACLIDDMLRRTRLMNDGSIRLPIAHALAEWTPGWVYKEIDGLVARFIDEWTAKGLEKDILPHRATGTIKTFLHQRLNVQDPSAPEGGHTFQFVTPPLSRALVLNDIYPATRVGAAEERAAVAAICATW